MSTSECSWPDIIVRPGRGIATSPGRLFHREPRERRAGSSSKDGEYPGRFRDGSLAAFPGDMEAATSAAAESDKVITWPVAAGCLVPEFQCNAMSLGALAVRMEHLAAGGIGAWKNPARYGHEYPYLRSGAHVRKGPATVFAWVARIRREVGPVQRSAGTLTRGERVETSRNACRAHSLFHQVNALENSG
jgi:hypothetical protein